MNPRFFTAPFYFAFIWFRVQGSGVWWRLRREYIWGDARRSEDRSQMSPSLIPNL